MLWGGKLAPTQLQFRYSADEQSPKPLLADGYLVVLNPLPGGQVSISQEKPPRQARAGSLMEPETPSCPEAQGLVQSGGTGVAAGSDPWLTEFQSMQRLFPYC